MIYTMSAAEVDGIVAVIMELRDTDPLKYRRIMDKMQTTIASAKIRPLHDEQVAHMEKYVDQMKTARDQGLMSATVNDVPDITRPEKDAFGTEGLRSRC